MRKILGVALGAMLCTAGLAGCPGGEIPNPANWVIVTTLFDVADGDTTSVEALRANPGPDAAVSLREALVAVNNTGPGFEIRFLPAGTIAPQTPLPPLEAGRTLLEGDGKIVLQGNQRAGLDTGLEIRSGENRIRGLRIVGFPGDGIDLAGPAASDNRIEGCRIGNDGNATQRNGGSGIRIRDGAVGNIVGGTASAARNILAGNDGWGVVVERDGGAAPRANVLEGNHVGMALNGVRALPNRLGGVRIDGGRENRVGGPGNGRNLISGNGGPGVELVGEATGNSVRNNLIGTTGTGSAGPGNTVGVRIAGPVTGTQIGGNAETDGNVIAGNRDGGVRIATGTRNTVRRNSIFDNDDAGIRLADAAANDGMPAPTVTAAARQPAGTYIVRGTAEANASVELFIDTGREGGLFAARLLAGADGRYSVELNLSSFADRSPRLNLTATATDRDGNTSEFSAPLPF